MSEEIRLLPHSPTFHGHPSCSRHQGTTYVKVANFPGLYRHARSGRYYACKKQGGIRREASLRTCDRKIAERRLKEWICNLDKVDAGVEKTTIGQLIQHQAVASYMVWLGEKVAALPTFEDTLLPGQNGDVLELDELWSFVQKKTQGCWLWVALCRRTRQIVAYTIGDRSQGGTMSLREHVPDDHRRRTTRSDFWLACGAALPQRTHRFCGKEEGETSHPERWFGTL